MPHIVMIVVLVVMPGLGRQYQTHRIFGVFVDDFGDFINADKGFPGEPTEPMATYATGGFVPRTEPALVHAGEFVVPRNGALISSSPEQTAILERMDNRLRNLERINSTGFATVSDEERRTRQEMGRSRETARV